MASSVFFMLIARFLFGDRRERQFSRFSDDFGHMSHHHSPAEQVNPRTHLDRHRPIIGDEPGFGLCSGTRIALHWLAIS